MAYVVKVAVDCENGCGRRFTHQVRSERNEPVGNFCERCAIKRCVRVQASEDRARGGPPPREPEPTGEPAWSKRNRAAK